MSSRRPSMSRTASGGATSVYLSTAGIPATSAHDLPSPAALAGLELVRPSSRGSVKSVEYNYHGGGGLGLSASRGAALARTRDGPPAARHGAIEEADELVVGGTRGSATPDAEGVVSGSKVVDEEIALTAHERVVLETEARAQLMYDRFTPRRKTLIVAVVSYAALLAPFSSASFLPSIPVIVEDLNTTATILNVTVAIFILVIGIGPLVWAPYAGVYGRKPIYVASLPIFALGSLGVALSTSLTALIITRIIQGFGSCAVLSVGAGTIGDLYPRETRGAAMGLFYSGVLLGPSIAPAVGGILTEYVHGTGYGSGWRAMQYLLCGMGTVGSVLVIFAFPETAHVKGADLIREARREAARNASPSEKALVKPGRFDDWVVVVLNPLAPLKLLARPHILAMALTSSFVLMSTYTVLVPLGETIRPRYHIDNIAVFGCFYLAQGFGNYTAAQIAGKYADYTLKRWKAKRKGVYVAEDRLRAAIEGGCFVLPLCIVALGWTVDKASGKGGIAACVLLLFFDGVGLMFVLTPTNTYCVDVMQHRSAEVIATINCVRYVFSAAASAFVLPMIDAIGVGWTNTFSAFVVWMGAALTLFVIRYGERIRNRIEQRERADEAAAAAAAERVVEQGKETQSDSTLGAGDKDAP